MEIKSPLGDLLVVLNIVTQSEILLLECISYYTFEFTLRNTGANFKQMLWKWLFVNSKPLCG